MLYLHFSEGFFSLPESVKTTYSPTSLPKRLFKVAGYAIVRLVGNLFKSVENPANLHGKVWLYVVSQNNYDSLKFIQTEIPDTVFVAGQSKAIGKYDNAVQRISLKRKLLYYYRFIPLLLQFLQAKPKITVRLFDVLFDAVGFYEVYLHKLKQHKPRCIVFANDHNPDARAMLLAARKLGIKTVYIQHASVSTYFPPLQFDLNLLEGQDSLDKYRMCGPVTGHVELIGMPKADAYVPLRNRNKRIQTIGIGLNMADPLPEIEKLLLALQHALPQTHLLVRPHPRDKRDFVFMKQNSKGISLSSPLSESTFDYLRRIDVQISGNSGIHLEAVLLNVWSVYYDFNQNDNLNDYYGFVKRGLVDTVPDAAALTELLKARLQHKPDVYLRARYYNATVGTDEDGRSSALAIKHIRNLLR